MGALPAGWWERSKRVGEGPRLQNFLGADLERLSRTGRTCPLRRTLLCAVSMAPAHCPSLGSSRHPSPWLLSGRGSVLCRQGRRTCPALPSHPGMEQQVRRPAWKNGPRTRHSKGNLSFRLPTLSRTSHTFILSVIRKTFRPPKRHLPPRGR